MFEKEGATLLLCARSSGCVNRHISIEFRETITDYTTYFILSYNTIESLCSYSKLPKHTTGNISVQWALRNRCPKTWRRKVIIDAILGKCREKIKFLQLGSESISLMKKVAHADKANFPSDWKRFTPTCHSQKTWNRWRVWPCEALSHVLTKKCKQSITVRH